VTTFGRTFGHMLSTWSFGSAGDRRAKAVGAEGGLSAATTSTVAGVVSLGTVRRSAPVLEAASRTQTRIGTAPAATDAAASLELMN
jgi:hypothetical protein